jgi:hypothetical protein
MDVDGPLIPARLHKRYSSGIAMYDYHADNVLKWDSNVISTLNEHCPPQNIRVVFNTAHNGTEGLNEVRNCAIRNGLHCNLIHPHHKTRFPDLIDGRVTAIYDWLHRNIPSTDACRWVVADDYELNIPQHQIKVNLDIGLTDSQLVDMFTRLMHETQITFYGDVAGWASNTSQRK